MANTYVAIAKSVLVSDTAAVTFSSIPATYTDLVVLCTVRGDATYTTNNGTSMYMRINSSSTAEYSLTRLYGVSTTVGSDRVNTANADTALTIYGSVNQSTETANTFSNCEIYIPNYAGSTYKAVSDTAVVETNGVAGYKTAQAGIWLNTAAITSLTFTYTYNAASKFLTGSSFYLYGIKSS